MSHASTAQWEDARPVGQQREDVRADRPGVLPRQPLRVLPIPDTEPAPEPPQPALPRTVTATAARPRAGGYVQESLAVRFRPSVEQSETDFGPRPTSSSDLPDPADWGGRIIRAVLEAMAGQRPAAQLVRWLAPEVHERVVRRGTLARQRREPHRHAPGVRALLSCEPADGVAELSAVVTHGGRVRALALRLTGVDGRWLVTALELG